MAYADYSYYTDTYSGSKLQETDFAKYAELSSLYIDNMLCNRLSSGATVTDNVRSAVCAVAEVWYDEDKQSDAMTASVKSESVDGDSVSYATAQEINTAWTIKKMALLDLYIPSTDPLRWRWL